MNKTDKFTFTGARNSFKNQFIQSNKIPKSDLNILTTVHERMYYRLQRRTNYLENFKYTINKYEYINDDSNKHITCLNKMSQDINNIGDVINQLTLTKVTVAAGEGEGEGEG